MQSLLNRLQPYLKSKFLIPAVLLVLIMVSLITWMRRPHPLSQLELQHQAVQCQLWQRDIDLMLSSLRTKFITDRDTYLLSHHQRLENQIENQLVTCLTNLNIKDIDTTLEDLAIQLSRKDEVALETIAALQENFVE